MVIMPPTKHPRQRWYQPADGLCCLFSGWWSSPRNWGAISAVVGTPDEMMNDDAGIKRTSSLLNGLLWLDLDDE